MSKKKYSILTFIICLFAFVFIAGCQANTTDNFPFISLTWEFDKSTGTITKYNGFSSNVKVPSKINGVEVVEIGKYAFSEKKIKTVTLPDGLLKINDGAFEKCYNLQDVNLPNSLQSIGSRAFMQCNGLVTITLPMQITVIQAQVFDHCTNLKSINLENITEISYSAFSRTGLTNVNLDSMTSINEYAFSNTPLKSVFITRELTNIHFTAFYECADIEYITVHEDNSVYKTDGNALCSKDGGELYRLIATKNLTNYQVPAWITSIENYAFEKCVSLESVTLQEGVTKIWYSAFMDCLSLQTISLPNSLKEIENSAFNGCSSLVSLTIPYNVHNIGGYNHDYSGFVVGCTSLTTFEVDELNAYYSTDGQALFDKTQTRLYGYVVKESENQYNIPSTVTTVTQKAFLNLKSLTVFVPNSVQIMEKAVFWGSEITVKIQFESGDIPSGWDNAWNWMNNDGSCVLTTLYGATL